MKSITTNTQSKAVVVKKNLKPNIEIKQKKEVKSKPAKSVKSQVSINVSSDTKTRGTSTDSNTAKLAISRVSDFKVNKEPSRPHRTTKEYEVQDKGVNLIVNCFNLELVICI